MEQYTTRSAPQHTERTGREPEHTHPAQTHAHDHFHVSLHHRGRALAALDPLGRLGEWEHRTYWHTHEHSHSELTHSHDYDRIAEERDHDQEAHVHDHSDPITPHG